MRRLIITGWGWKDYAVAAALTLRHYQNADVVGMSTRRLPEFLKEVTGYQEIIIVGVGLLGNPELLEVALKKLSSKKVKVSWISSMPFPEILSDEIRSKLDIFIDGENLTDAVSCCYDIAYDDIAPLIFEPPATADAKEYHQLLEAAMYVYRNYQNESAYGNAIRHIANGDKKEKWTHSEKQMVERYKRFGSRELVGTSPVMTDLLEKIDFISQCAHARVLILGESGTGKETVALQIHNKSSRQNEPFIAFNCANVTPNLLESRFLGHEKGAFTGATEQKRGIFEQADGGTLFLDEIGELPLEAQGLLLRVLEGGRFTRMGEKEEIEVDVRLIAATNRDLASMVRDGKFREDLFHRLNVIQIHIPSLREHKGDIGKIANAYWLKQYKRRLEPSQIEALTTYDYPGNVRELFNILERASVLHENDFNKLINEHKRMTENLTTKVEYAYPDDLEEMIKQHIRRVYENSNNNLSQAAIKLNSARNTVKKYLV